MFVVILPGILGSELNVSAGFPWPSRRIWPDPFALALGDLALLQLGPDGDSPGPLAQGLKASAGAPMPYVYGPMALALGTLGHTVIQVGWDWRKDLLAQGAVVWNLVAQLAGSQGIAVVGHSAGGLVAIAALKAAGSAGAQIERIITLGTPWYGSWSTARLWWRQSQTYRGLRQLCGWRHAPRQGPLWLDATVATWPALYELMPFAASGPLSVQYPDQVGLIYGQPWYLSDQANPYVSANWLTVAPATQAQLNPFTPHGIVRSIIGVGTPTVSAIASPYGRVGPPPSYLYENGDGTVTVAQGAPGGVQTAAVPYTHDLLPLAPEVIALVAGFL